MHDAFAHLADRLENRRDRYINDPAGWVQARLAGHLWSKQKQVADLLVRNKRVAVRSCHAAGKTRLAASLACWWIDVHPPGEALVISTAPSHAQVHGVLWEEIRKIHAAAGLDGRILGSDQWVLADGTLVGVGRRPVDEAAWQGYHRPYTLVIMDEACGIPAWTYTSMETVSTGPSCRILAIGNPDDAASEFAKLPTKDGWKALRISAFDTPAYTGENVPPYLQEGQGRLIDRAWVEQRRTAWGEDSPLWRAKIEAEFADSESGLIPYSWISAANRRWLDWRDTADTTLEHGIRVFGVDVAGTGQNADRTAIATREGDIVRAVESWRGLDTTQVTGLVQAKLRSALNTTSVVDVIGIGTGVVDQLRRAGSPVTAYNGARASRARDATGSWQFKNLRSQSWWTLRELLDPALDGKLALPPDEDDDLANELTAPRYEIRAGGYLVVELKDETKRRLGRSPDLADAVVMACHTQLGSAQRDWEPEYLRRRRHHPVRQYAATQNGYDISAWTPRGMRDGGGWRTGGSRRGL